MALRVAILATYGFEKSELIVPRERLQALGATVDIVAPNHGTIQAWERRNWIGDTIAVDASLAKADASIYDGLILPGGLYGPDKLRVDERAVSFVREFVAAGKPVGAICHAAWLLIEAGAVVGRRVTAYPSLRTDLINAGADWQDAPVVVDGPLVTSRKPDDLVPFMDAVIAVLTRRPK